MSLKNIAASRLRSLIQIPSQSGNRLNLWEEVCSMHTDQQSKDGKLVQSQLLVNITVIIMVKDCKNAMVNRPNGAFHVILQ